MEIILTFLATWSPALVAILGIVTTVAIALGKCYNAVKELKDETTLKELNSRLNSLISKNEELTRCNKLLLDQITKIQGYADTKKVNNGGE